MMTPLQILPLMADQSTEKKIQVRGEVLVLIGHKVPAQTHCKVSLALYYFHMR